MFGSRIFRSRIQDANEQMLEVEVYNLKILEFQVDYSQVLYYVYIYINIPRYSQVYSFQLRGRCIK